MRKNRGTYYEHTAIYREINDYSILSVDINIHTLWCNLLLKQK